MSLPSSLQHFISHSLPQDEALEETGWKLVHGDVFRSPSKPTLLVACLGSGIQIFCMVLIIIGKVTAIASAYSLLASFTDFIS